MPWRRKGKWGSLNPVALLHKRIAGHGFAPSLTYFHGCDYDDIDLPSDHLEFNDLIVVVRKGGECSLWDKLLLASNMNFSALIEYDSDSDVEMEGLSDYAADSERGESPIVYALAIKPFGSFVEDLYRNGSHPHLSLAAGQTTIMRIGVNKTSVLFVATSFVVLTIISLAWLLFYYVQRFRYLHSRDRTKKRLAAAAKKALTLLQVKILKKGINEISEEDNCCSICIDDFQYGDAVRELPCSHKFHRACVDPWLVSHYNCPNCKTNVLKALNLIDKVNLPRTQEDEENSVGGSSSAGGIAMTTPVVAPGVGGRGASSGIGNGGGGRMSLVLSITVPSTPPDDDNQDNNDWLRSHCIIPSTSSSATNPTAVTKNNAEKMETRTKMKSRLISNQK
ncbi:RING finger protein 150-like isoform X2 [Symsagittifera roscoffensis]|uniref:RING finger protein 150-like isoform X2 n=1 Tax=Symsagittifera roscoffensis TaxID=84072 RepID=UPI00307BF790